MSTIGTDIRNDIKAAQNLHLPWWVLVMVMVASLPTIWAFDHWGRYYLALPAINCVLVFGFLVAVKWELRKRPWFWFTLIAIAALHVPLLLSIPWTTAWVPAAAIAVIDSVDLCAILAVLSIMRRLIKEI